ncbi:unnamed protein product [Nezara viridula]|uniref:Palmitoyltransferase n=1 Tax=Nezara viridula TaxID=85310 RepID=A0A9P0MX19_NEZVI|nr:unnamed protein product [Nezara viridula]
MAPRTLCCCEYISSEGDIRHLLDCCCNCPEIDYCFDRLITCKPIPTNLCARIMTGATERIRFPWKGGAKQCSLHVILPVVALPLFLTAAAQGLWISVVAFSFLPIFLTYLHYILMKFYSYSSFFFVWNVASFVEVFLIFEAIGVALLEIRADENIAFICLTLCVCFCIYKIKQKEKLSHVLAEYDGDFKFNLLCPECNVKIPPRTFHCYTCQACILMRGQHCAWFNCCIGEKNHKWYMLFLIFSIVYLLFCANLILTTACHPVQFIGAIMLPDDCSEVYFDSLCALCFVTSIYCIEAAIFIMSVFVFEIWLISLGMTGHEYRNRSKRSFFCGLLSSRPYSKGIIRNWLNYFKGSDASFLYYNI